MNENSIESPRVMRVLGVEVTQIKSGAWQWTEAHGALVTATLKPSGWTKASRDRKVCTCTDEELQPILDAIAAAQSNGKKPKEEPQQEEPKTERKQQQSSAHSSNGNGNGDLLRRVPPQDLDAEMSVLGAILISRVPILDDVSRILRPESFYRETHREIYKAMLVLDERGEPLDVIPLCNYLRSTGALDAIGGPAYLAELAAAVPTAANFAHYAMIVRDKALLRILGSIGTDIASGAYDNPHDVREFMLRVDRQFTRMHTLVPAAAEQYADRQAVDAFKAYQTMVGEHREYSVEGAIRDGCTAVVSALIGAGKTTLAMNLARAWALGLLFLGRVCRQSRTLVVVSPKEFEAWADTIGFWKLEGLIFLVESTKAHFNDRAETVRWFDSEMRRLGCRTFVLDTLFDFSGMPPNIAGDANRIIMNEQAPFLQMVRERDYSGLVTGHSPKSEAKAIDPRDPEEAFAGNTAWTAQHRMRITIRRKSQGINAIITGRGGYGDRGILKEELLLFDEETRLVSLGGLFSDHLGEAAMPSVIDTMRDFGGPISMPKLIEQMGKSEKWVRAGVKAGRKAEKIDTDAVKGKRNAKYWLRGQNADDSTLL